MKLIPNSHRAKALECGSMIAHTGNLYFNGKFIKKYRGTYMFKGEVWCIPSEGLAKVEEEHPEWWGDGMTHWYLFIKNNDNEEINYDMYELETELEIAKYSSEWGYCSNFEAIASSSSSLCSSSISSEVSKQTELADQ